MGVGVDTDPEGLERSATFNALLDNLATDATEGLIPFGKSGGGGLTDDAGLEYGAATGQLLLGDGSASNPSYGRKTGTTGGLYFSGNDPIIARNGSAVMTFGSVILARATASDSAGNRDFGTAANRWRYAGLKGVAFGKVNTASASYTADVGDHTVVLTAATAALVLPAVATVGGGFELLVKFEGATSRTITPDGAETADVASPEQDAWYRLIADTDNTNWRAVRVDGSVYSEIFVAAGSTTQVTNGTTLTFDVITGFNTAQGVNGDSNGATPVKASNKITLDKAGVYSIHFNCSWTGTTNETYTVAAFIGGSEISGACFSRKIGTGTDMGSASFTAMAAATAGQDLDVRVKAIGTSSDFIPAFMNLNAVYLGA